MLPQSLGLRGFRVGIPRFVWAYIRYTWGPPILEDYQHVWLGFKKKSLSSVRCSENERGSAVANCSADAEEGNNLALVGLAVSIMISTSCSFEVVVTL